MKLPCAFCVVFLSERIVSYPNGRVTTPARSSRSDDLLGFENVDSYASASVGGSGSASRARSCSISRRSASSSTSVGMSVARVVAAARHLSGFVFLSCSLLQSLHDYRRTASSSARGSNMWRRRPGFDSRRFASRRLWFSDADVFSSGTIAAVPKFSKVRLKSWPL